MTGATTRTDVRVRAEGCDDLDRRIVYQREGPEIPAPEAGDFDPMPNRILDCLDGRCASSELTSHELRLLEKIEAGLRTRSREYRTTDRLDRLYGSSRALPRRGQASKSGRRDLPIPSHRSALDAFLERSARRELKAG